uniref:Uncharacterized protein n=1 Tax=Oryza brachyantha TaxID=4533 RepID=J3LJU1_ORYBR
MECLCHKLDCTVMMWFYFAIPIFPCVCIIIILTSLSSTPLLFNMGTQSYHTM